MSGQYQGHLRLVDNSGSTGGYRGRLEVFLSGEWGTVCDKGFGSADASVACKQLGYSSSNTSFGSVEDLGYVHISCSYIVITH